MTTRPSLIFFGNGPLADATLSILSETFDILFAAHTRADLDTVRELKLSHPNALGVLASFGVLIKSDLLDLFEPVGILNIHPSLLPLYRGASPIESALLAGDTSFSVSVMKLAPAMDAGPLYYQTTLDDLPLDKSAIYSALATAGARWICEHYSSLPTPVAQDDTKATFCTKLDKSLSPLLPAEKSASHLLREVVAFAGFPRSRYTFFGVDCIILSAHVSSTAPHPLSLRCADGNFLVIDRLMPAGRRPMDAQSFLNGYQKSKN